MGVGKTAVQVSHASLAVLLLNKGEVVFFDDENIKMWLKGRFVKIVTYVKSKQKMLNLAKKLDNLGIRNKMIYDACFTVLDPEEEDGTTLTCMGVIPLKRDETPKCLKTLQLLE